MRRWIVVADAARARIFEQEAADSPLRETTSLVHGETALHAGDLRTGGKGGTVSGSASNNSFRQSELHATTTETHSERFAKEVADHLRQGRARGSFGCLVLIAEPRFLGRLRANVDSATGKLLELTIDKSLVESSLDRIGQELEGQSR